MRLLKTIGLLLGMALAPSLGFAQGSGQFGGAAGGGAGIATPVSVANGGTGSASGTQFSIPDYATTATFGTVCTPPATNGIFVAEYQVTATAAVAPTCPQAGVASRVVSGSTATDTIGASTINDSVCIPIIHDVAGSANVAVTLPTPTTLANANACIIYENHSAQTDTITPTTFQIQSNTSAAAASLSIAPGTATRITVDPFNSNVWDAFTVALSSGSGTVSACTHSNAIGLYGTATSTTIGCGNGDFTYATHTLAGGASGIFELDAAGDGALIPPHSGCTTNTGKIYLSIHSAGSNELCQNNGGGSAISYAVAGVGAFSTTCTNQVVTVVSGSAAPTCTTLTNQFLPGTVFSRVVMTSDWTCGTGGTVSSCTTAVIVGSTTVPMTFTLPSVALNWTLDCDGVVGSATGDPANNWNLITATNAPTNTMASYSMGTAAAVGAFGATTGNSSTTTFNIGGAWTLGGTATKMPFHIHARIEGASASGTVVSLQLVDPTVADFLTIYRGTSCWVHQ